MTWRAGLLVVAGVALGACGDGSADADAAIDDRDVEYPLPASLALSPSVGDFGDVVTGGSSEPLSFEVANVGESAASPLLVSIEGGDSADYSIAADDCSGVVLDAGARCSVEVTFAPSSVGLRASSLVVTAAIGGSESSELTGSGLEVDGITIAPTPYDFGGVGVAMSSPGVDFTVTNFGSPTGPIDVSLTGADAIAFEIVADECSGPGLAAGAFCTITLSFRPTSMGAKAASLAATASPGGIATASVSGDGLATEDGSLTIAPLVQNYGWVCVGSSGDLVSFTVANPGTEAVSMLPAWLTGADAADFAVVADLCSGATLTPGATCTVVATFAPAWVGGKSATLNVVASTTAPAVAVLHGSGLICDGGLALAPTPHDFGAAVVGSVGSGASFTVWNVGGAATGIMATSRAGANPSDFVIVADGCDGTALAAGTACVVDVEFAPTAAGPRNAALSVTAIPGGVATASLSGTGLSPALLQVTPGNRNFGSVATGAASIDVSFLVTNLGDAVSGVPLVTLGGPDATEFGMTLNDCTSGGLPGGASCTVKLRFIPTSPGSKSATLDVVADPGGSDSSALMGNGVDGPHLSVSPTIHDFGDVVVGATSATQTFIVTNTHFGTTGTIATGLSGADASDFAIVSNTCEGVTLDAGISCVIEARFAPGSVGIEAAQIDISASPGGLVEVPLDGTGLAP